MTTQNTTTIVERSVDRIKKSIDIIFARFENIKIMIRCNTNRIDLIHDSTIPRIEKKVKRLEQTIMDHIDPTVGLEHKTVKSQFIISDEQRTQYKSHLKKVLRKIQDDMELMINDPDDGSWKGR